MADNSNLLRPIGIAAGGLGSVSIKNNVAFTYLEQLGISTVQVANSVKCDLHDIFFNLVVSTCPVR
jgi:hypothetical protein